MRVLITGGAGFIGSHTVERLLANGHDVTILDNFNDYYDPAIKRENIRAVRDQITLVEGDLREKEDVEQAYTAAPTPVDAVIHLAARAGVRPSIEQPELYIDTNIKGTFHMLEAAKRHDVKRFVFASSSSVYGVNKKVPFAEVDPILQTISPYAMTKMAGEQMCSNYSALYDIRTVCLRFFTVYGPRQRPDLAISKFTRLIHEDKPIDRYGDGSTARDYTFIRDIVDGILGALEYTTKADAPKCDIFNLGGSQTVTLNEMIGAIEKALDKKAQINAMPEQPGDVPLTSADVNKASTVLHFKPTTHIDTGIPEFVKWWLEMRAKGLR
jgi:UDP-glucuronate 4-epimerase